MNDHSRSQLKQAYKLIKADQKSEALALLKPIVQNEPDNVDAWWLVTFTVVSPAKAIRACQQVLALKPDHAAARQLLAELENLTEQTAQASPPQVASKMPRAESRTKSKRSEL